MAGRGANIQNLNQQIIRYFNRLPIPPTGTEQEPYLQTLSNKLTNQNRLFKKAWMNLKF